MFPFWTPISVNYHSQFLNISRRFRNVLTDDFLPPRTSCNVSRRLTRKSEILPFVQMNGARRFLHFHKKYCQDSGLQSFRCFKSSYCMMHGSLEFQCLHVSILIHRIRYQWNHSEAGIIFLNVFRKCTPVGDSSSCSCTICSGGLFPYVLNSTLRQQFENRGFN